VVLGTRRQTARTTLAASAALAATVVPVFLAGALSGPIGEELGFGPAAAGLAITGFFVAAGVAAVPMARLTSRLGVRVAMRAGIAVSGAGCLLLATAARSWWHLAVLLVLVGSVVGLVDTAAAGAFAGTIRRARQGLAFGVKEASVPIASMIAGVSVPLAAAWWGWRAAFATVALLFPLAWLLVPADRTVPSEDGGEEGPPVTGGTPPPSTAGAADTGPVTVTDTLAGAGEAEAAARSLAPVRALAVGIAAGAGAANAAATLLVPTATAGGLSGSAAGVLLAVASVASVAVRVGAGWAADRAALSPVTWVTGALALGAAGTAILAVGVHPVTVTAGAMLTLGAGWGWTGLAFLAAIRLAPTVPARAAGTVLTGLAIGGALGPSAFAALAASSGAPTAWSAASIAFVVGAAVTALAGRRAPR
jgi:MFS family permease